MIRLNPFLMLVSTRPNAGKTNKNNICALGNQRYKHCKKCCEVYRQCQNSTLDESFEQLGCFRSATRQACTSRCTVYATRRRETYTTLLFGYASCITLITCCLYLPNQLVNAIIVFFCRQISLPKVEGRKIYSPS